MKTTGLQKTLQWKNWITENTPMKTTGLQKTLQWKQLDSNENNWITENTPMKTTGLQWKQLDYRKHSNENNRITGNTPTKTTGLQKKLQWKQLDYRQLDSLCYEIRNYFKTLPVHTLCHKSIRQLTIKILNIQKPAGSPLNILVFEGRSSVTCGWPSALIQHSSSYLTARQGVVWLFTIWTVVYEQFNWALLVTLDRNV
jgi:hypothetical protein